MAAVLLTALTISAEWERGSMEQLFASPVGRLEIVLGKLLPYLGLGMLQLLLVVAVGAVIFDVPIRGSTPCSFRRLSFSRRHAGPGPVHLSGGAQPVGGHQAGALSSLLPSLLLSGMLVLSRTCRAFCRPFRRLSRLATCARHARNHAQG